MACSRADVPRLGGRHSRSCILLGECGVQVPNIYGFWSQKNTIKGMAFGTRDLKYWVLGPSGLYALGPKVGIISLQP